ncbi:hypothetical protein ACFFQW_42365 [Umezawaea endophytica]|uniref:Uncharacterized protein n=1 Tax=Umezawaea endophytica TaxID=1654476 RepID=A0A9X3A211_9PSEU|nr:hypothetical protein [Umezawaea endophytica]MCS7480209.1 hypothetical protein [Umezawaea endophytica]
MNWTERPLVLSERTLRRGWETGWALALPLVAGALTWTATGNAWLTLFAAVVLGVLFFQIARPGFEVPPSGHPIADNAADAAAEPVWAQVRWISSPRVPRVVPVVALATAPGGEVRQVFQVACGDAPGQLRADGIPFAAELVSTRPPLLRISGEEPVALRRERSTAASVLADPDYADPPRPPTTRPLTQWWQRPYARRAAALLTADPQWIPVRLVPAAAGPHGPWVVVRPSDGHVLARQYLPRAVKGVPRGPHSALMGVPRGSAVLDENEAGDSVDGVLYGQGWSNPALLRGIRIRHVG